MPRITIYECDNCAERITGRYFTLKIKVNASDVNDTKVYDAVCSISCIYLLFNRILTSLVIPTEDNVNITTEVQRERIQ